MYLSQNENIQILHEDEHLVIRYSPESTIMYCYWRGFIAARRIQQLGAVMIRCVKEKGVSRVLNDNTGVVGPWNSIAPWVVNQWFPEMFQAGLKYFAWVMPENSFALLSARDAMPHVSNVRAFNLETDALAWLLNPEEEATFRALPEPNKTASKHRALYDLLCLTIHHYDPVAAAIMQAELGHKTRQPTPLPGNPGALPSTPPKK